ncbi:hypothetical protein SAMN05880501_105173 [Ureibacillus xyleni]|uniref:Uncharacterized protein n=1 Tax=Ureibacillus xyleni TaxID=614648 RepID=A0A285SM89_9BACL|nr:hypothetical protein [Ureibacillus xyleni]SOC09057.1 hypothetical protein SAMN05880501_105173 [Ureibacillus xyleni]
MFDLKKWQRNLKEDFMNDVEKAKLWSNQINPIVEELLPTWDSILNRLEENVQQQVNARQSSYPIICSFSKPGMIGNGFTTMLDEDFERHIITKQPFNSVSNEKLLHILKDYKSEFNISTPIWVQSGICYGDEHLLQQQRVMIRLYSGNNEALLEGAYVRYEGALQNIERLLSRARQIQQTIPFVPDYYASRFYVLQVNEIDSASIANWTTIDRVEIEPFEQQVEDEVKIRLYEEPVWNVKLSTLEPKIGSRKLVSNGLHRRDFISTIETQWLPLVPDNGVLCSFEMEPSIGFRATVELPGYMNTLPVATFHEIKVEGNMIHNKKIENVQIHHSQYPTIADFQQLTQIYPYINCIEIVEAKLEIQPALEGELWRRDCIVLSVKDKQDDDVFITSRMRALEQLVYNYWPYAACRVELVGESHA